MTLGRLVLRSLFYHWRGNLAVFLGVALGTAVLTGALLVGDSLRGSLRDLTLEQLGWVDQALVSGRFVREKLAEELGVEQFSAAIFLRGSASRQAKNAENDGGSTLRRVGQVTLIGVDGRFWAGGKSPADNPSANYPGGMGFWASEEQGVVLNQALADELGAKPGDEINFFLPKTSDIPRESFVGRRDVSDVLAELTLTVRAVLPNEGLGRFNLNPSPAIPRNAFVPLPLLQKRLRQEGKINAILAYGSTRDLQRSLQQHLTPDDWGLVLHTPQSRVQSLFDRLDRNHDGKLTPNEWRRRVAESFVRAADADHDGVLERKEVLDFYVRSRNYLSLESRQLLLDSVVADAAHAAAKEMGLTSAPTLVYLANSISDGSSEIPYSIVAALDPKLPAPLGPFLPREVDSLKDGEIILAAWKDSPLQVKPGSEVALTYFPPEESNRLRQQTTKMTVRGLLPLSGVADDPDLTPEFPGITDKLDIRDWNPPFPYDNKRIKPRDERYWEEYRTTPKAYVSLSEGQKLWASRFGSLTSIRFASAGASSQSSEEISRIADDFTRRLLRHLRPKQGGFVFDAVRDRGLAGSAGSTDFGGLFIGFSLFLIVAALLLVGLLYRLNMDRRAPEIGLLSAAGYRRRTVRWLLLAEGGLVTALGGILGIAGAIAYAWLVLELFRAWWPGGLDRSFLRLHAGPLSFAIGYVGSLLATGITIAWAVRSLAQVSTQGLLAGETGPPTALPVGNPRRNWSGWVVCGAMIGVIGAIVLGGLARDQEMRAMGFFASGALLLTAGLAAIRLWMNHSRHSPLQGRGKPALSRLGVRNAARYPLRSLLTVGLLAFATFSIVAIESFYKSAGKDFLDHNSGGGGFTLLAESDVPVYQDLNSANGLEELSVPDKTRAALKGVSFVQFRLRPGDDASCLNLYQPRTPRILGVPQAFISRGGFNFASSESTSPEERANPWLLLDKRLEDGAIPTIGDANTITWILHTGLGKEIEVQNDQGQAVRLRIVGLLQDSIFQSELLLSEQHFLSAFPRQEGYRFFLVDAPPDRVSEVRTALETTLADQGFFVTPTAQRLESYLAVENTYLQTFQALGGLGLALGALGLGVVLTRSVWERRGEFALLRAIGFPEAALRWLVLAENVALLVLGLAVGTVAALVAVSPEIVAGVGQIPWSRLAGLLLVVLVVGMVAGWAALMSSLRAPLLEALRRE
jgi:ABC-type antimicrobial peptide transport system permease subunit